MPLFTGALRLVRQRDQCPLRQIRVRCAAQSTSFHDHRREAPVTCGRDRHGVGQGPGGCDIAGADLQAQRLPPGRCVFGPLFERPREQSPGLVHLANLRVIRPANHELRELGKVGVLEPLKCLPRRRRCILTRKEDGCRQQRGCGRQGIRLQLLVDDTGFRRLVIGSEQFREQSGAGSVEAIGVIRLAEQVDCRPHLS